MSGMGEQNADSVRRTTEQMMADLAEKYGEATIEVLNPNCEGMQFFSCSASESRLVRALGRIPQLYIWRSGETIGEAVSKAYDRAQIDCSGAPDA